MQHRTEDTPLDEAIRRALAGERGTVVLED